MEKQANSRNCFVCGLENPYGLKLKFYQSEPGEVTVYYTVPEHYQGYPGIAHGGVVAAILDETASRALIGPGEANPRFVYTARLTVRYRHHVPIDAPLRIIGRVIKDRERVATAETAIYAEDGTVLVDAEALLVEVPEEVLASADLEALGWKVYPDEPEERQPPPADGRPR